jgi:DNA-binding transcriptional ArsR family regulator
VARRQLPVLQEGSAPVLGTIDIGDEERAGRLAALGRALSDPIRVKMLGMLAEGRGCCELPDCGVPAKDQDAGICVCEFERGISTCVSRRSPIISASSERPDWCMKSDVARGASTHSTGRPQGNCSPRPRPIWIAAQAKMVNRRAGDRMHVLCTHNSARSQMAEGC